MKTLDLDVELSQVLRKVAEAQRQHVSEAEQALARARLDGLAREMAALESDVRYVRRLCLLLQRVWADAEAVSVWRETRRWLRSRAPLLAPLSAADLISATLRYEQWLSYVVGSRTVLDLQRNRLNDRVSEHLAQSGGRGPRSAPLSAARVKRLVVRLGERLALPGRLRLPTRTPDLIAWLTPA